MKIKIIHLVCILIVFESFGQEPTNDTIPETAYEVSLPTKIAIDTLRIQNLETKEIAKAWYKDNNMPWIIALVISTLGIFINMHISNQQIRANREITLRQIKATLSTSNRQEWVIDTRNVITELLTNAKLLNIEFQENQSNSKERKNIYASVTYNRNKLLLLLKPDKQLHKNLLDSVSELITTLDEHLLNSKAKDERGKVIPFNNKKFLEQMDKVIESGRILLYDEWGKIQSIA